jgi:phage terminase large subunit GpA-like protein
VIDTESAALADGARGAWEPRPALTVSGWADRHRTIVGRGSAEPGRWSTDRAPYLRGIMDAFNDPRVRRISVIKSTRLGVTEALINMLGYIVDYAPAPTLWVYPNEKLAQKVNTDRLMPTLRQCPAIARHFTPNKHDVGVMEVRFDRMTLRFAGSNSPANLESFGYKYPLVDELDRCDPSTLGQIEGRVAEYADYKIVSIGTPSMEDVGIHLQVYGRSDQRSYHVPCPHCGGYHTRHFANVGWDGGLGADPAEVARSAWIVCPLCGAVIEAFHNLWQLKRGVWAKRGQRVEKDGTVHDTDESRSLPTDHAGFILNGLYNPFGTGNPYGRVASRFVERRGRPDQEWVTQTLGEAWSQKGDRLEVNEVRKLCKPVSNGGYRLGTCPPGCIVLTVAADIQTDRVYLTVRGWSAGGRDSWLIDHARLDSSEGDGLIVLETWVHENRRRYGVNIGAWFIDSGDRTAEVYGLVRRLNRAGVPGVVPVKGYFRHTDSRPHFWGWTEKGTNSKPPPGSLRLLNINTDHWKSFVLSRLKPAVAHGAAQAGTDAGAWHFPEDASDDYLDQLTSEHRVRKEVGEGGRVEYVWQKRPGRIDNHYFDCEVYESAGADALGVRNLSVGAAGAAASGQPPRRPAPDEADRRRGVGGSPLIQRARERRGTR